MMDDRERMQRFTALTERALSETNDDKFIEVLLERKGICDSLIGEDPSWIKEENLLKEEEILKRLERIKKGILSDMEKLSKRKTLLKAYHPRFPFPPMPAFFEKEE